VVSEMVVDHDGGPTSAPPTPSGWWTRTSPDPWTTNGPAPRVRGARQGRPVVRRDLLLAAGRVRAHRRRGARELEVVSPTPPAPSASTSVRRRGPGSRWPRTPSSPRRPRRRSPPAAACTASWPPTSCGSRTRRLRAGPRPVLLRAALARGGGVNAVPAPAPDGAVAWHHGTPAAEARALEVGTALVDLSQLEVVTVGGPDRSAGSTPSPPSTWPPWRPAPPPSADPLAPRPHRARPRRGRRRRGHLARHRRGRERAARGVPGVNALRLPGGGGPRAPTSPCSAAP
jgi:hypothetical protein